MVKDQDRIINEVAIRRILLAIVPLMDELSEHMRKVTFEIGYGRFSVDFDIKHSEMDQIPPGTSVEILLDDPQQ